MEEALGQQAYPRRVLGAVEQHHEFAVAVRPHTYIGQRLYHLAYRVADLKADELARADVVLGQRLGNAKHNGAQPLGLYVNAVEAELIRGIFLGRNVGDELLKEYQPELGHILAQRRIEALLLVLAALVGEAQLRHRLYGLDKTGIGHGLEQIAVDSAFDAELRELKAPVAGNKDEAHVGAALLDDRRKLDAVCGGHDDIGDDYIRAELLLHPLGGQAVICRTGYLDSEILPFERAHQKRKLHRFVVHDKQLEHIKASFY